MSANGMEPILDRLIDTYQELSPQLRRAAQYVLDHPNEIGVSSIRQVATAADVKPNTLVRMAKALGFEGYEDFRRPFRDVLRQGVESFPDRARWLQSLAQGGSHGQLFSQMAAANLSNIEQTFSGTSADEAKAVADRIVASRTTYVLGVGSCHSIAHNFCYVARMALDNVVAVGDQGNLPVDGLARIGRKDLLLAMTFSPYRTEVVEATRLAKKRGARLVAVTDSRASPIAFDADHVFVAATGTPQFFMSVVAVVALLELLIAFMVADADRRVVANIEEFHRIRYETGVYWDEGG
ncbi:MAG: MurR/RpiR family transcriptional regulator [Gammaproteobacteria bacterium]|nr:MurR/RpiR family transcriptional regulator [Gammaproteobacteria bacterium]